MKVRSEVAVEPRVVGLLGHLDLLADGCGHPAHQLGLHVTVDLAFVDLDPVKPAVVLLETEQRAGVVEQDRAHIVHGCHRARCEESFNWAINLHGS